MKAERKTIEELLDDNGEWKDYKLCFIGLIPETIMDYDERSKAYMNNPNFNWELEKEIYGYCSPNLRMIDIPNPEREGDKYTLYAFFSKKEPKDVRGDDWDDQLQTIDDWGHWSDPYEEDLLKVPFNLLDWNTDYRCIFPQDSRCYSAEDVNNGACAWIYARAFYKNLPNIVINAGINPYQFIVLINDIK